MVERKRLDHFLWLLVHILQCDSFTPVWHWFEITPACNLLMLEFQK